MIAATLSACSSSPEGEELVKHYIQNSSFPTDRGIYDVQILFFDSLFSQPSDDLSYKELLKEAKESLMEAEKNYSNCEKWMNSWWSKKDDYPIGLPLVDFHKKHFIECLMQLKEMNKVFKHKHIGFKCYGTAKYKTNFSDSLLVGEFILSPDKKTFIEKPIIEYPLDVNQDILPFIKLANMNDSEVLESLAEDTIYLRIPQKWREAYERAHQKKS